MNYQTKNLNSSRHENCCYQAELFIPIKECHLKAILINLIGLCLISTYAYTTDTFAIGSRVLLKEQGGFACLGTIQDVSAKYLKFEFEHSIKSNEHSDSSDFNDCKYKTSKSIKKRHFELATETDSALFKGFMGYGDTEFLVGDRVWFQRPYGKACIGTIKTIVNQYAKIDFDPATKTFKNCNYIKNKLIGLKDIEHS